VPFGQQIAGAVWVCRDLTFFTSRWNSFSSTVWVGILGLGLSEAAYMAEIARAGILSVDKGQNEAAQALGMSSGQTMRRIVLPQAMRVIVPPTGNETIAMVKDTSLHRSGSIITELYYQAYALRAAELQDHARPSSRPPSGTSSSVRSSWSASPTWSVLRPRLRCGTQEDQSRRLMKIEADH
jgi:polar amino acid transport system permease protein